MRNAVIRLRAHPAVRKASKRWTYGASPATVLMSFTNAATSNVATL